MAHRYCCTACTAACFLRQLHNYSTRLLMALAKDTLCTLASLNAPIGCCNLESCQCGQLVSISILNQPISTSCAKSRYFVYYLVNGVIKLTEVQFKVTVITISHISLTLPENSDSSSVLSVIHPTLHTSVHAFFMQ